MKITIRAFALLALTTMISANLLAANFFSGLDIQQVQKIFDQADLRENSVFVNHTAIQAIPSVQILPQVSSAQRAIKPGTRCIKVYSCNQGICLIALGRTKLAVNESIFNSLTTKVNDENQCATAAYSDQQLAIKTVKPTMKPAIASAKYSWVKVINVKANDSLNIRQKANYKTKKMGSVAYNGSCIKRYKCAGKWCNIQANNITGWVHRKFLQKLTPAQANSCSWFSSKSHPTLNPVLNDIFNAQQ